MSDPWLSFHPLLSLPFLLGTLVLLGGLLTWKESGRTIRFRPFRIIAQLIIIVALAGILLRPSFKTEQSISFVLLTPNVDTKYVDSLLQATPALRLIHLPGVKKYRGSKPLTSYHELTKLNGQINFIAGQGLPAHALDLLSPGSFQYSNSYLPAGVIQLKIPPRVVPDEGNKIEGLYNNTSGETTLLLRGPGESEDSMILSRTGIHSFSFSFTPRQAGNFLYTLIEKKGTGKQTDDIPVHVDPRQTLRILFIQQFPTFETQYLKSFLGKHHRITLRYQLSKNTFRYEYINQPESRVDKLTQKALNEYDLLILDTDALQILSGNEASELKKSIQNGLGMVILLNEHPAKVKNLKSFLPLEFKSVKTDTAHLFISSKKKIVLPAWAIVPSDHGSLTAITKNKNRILSGYLPEQAGKTGFQLLQETYRLSLEGDSVAYSSVWSSFIGRIARSHKKDVSIEFVTPFPVFENDPIELKAITSGAAPDIQSDSTILSFIEDVNVDGTWKTKIWAGSPGWHALASGTDSFNYYVHRDNSWSSLATTKAMDQTLLRSAGSAPKINSVEMDKTVPPWIFYLLFLISAGFLWLAPKW